MKWFRLVQQGAFCFLGTSRTTTCNKRQQQGATAVTNADCRSVADSAWRCPSLLSRRKQAHCGMMTTPQDNNGMERSDDDPQQVHYQVLDNIQRVFCISDLHTDHVDNLKWLRQRQEEDPKSPETDLIIVAGDISHEYDRFSETLVVLRQCAQVLFVPGNHEAWLNHHDKNNHADDNISSLEKLDRIYKLCHEHDVYTKPLYISGNYPLWILPLQSWYDGTLSFAEEHCQDFNKWPWVDFVRCEWSPPFELPPKDDPENNGRIPIGLVEFFLKRNEEYLQHLRPLIRKQSAASTATETEQDTRMSSNNVSILTVSHFLPNFQSLPDWKDLTATEFDVENWLDHGGSGVASKFAKVAGSTLIDEQIRSIMSLLDEEDTPTKYDENSSANDVVVQTSNRNGVSRSTLGGARSSRIHVFGHSHRPKDFFYHGIRYIHNPLGKPRERETQVVAPDVDFQLLWENSDNGGGGEVAATTLLRFWEERAGGVEALWQRMAEMNPSRYHRMERKKKKKKKAAATKAKLEKASSLQEK